MSSEQALLKAGMTLPVLPDKLFFSIREVSEVCGVEPHVLRYWETEFKHIKPVKRTGNRRFYRPRDVYAVLQIKHLLYSLNFTIRGAKKRMQNGDLEDIVEQKDSRTTLTQVRQELNDILSLLS
ncbi:MAG: MerR family transcriptional regulator [Mariprofundus sp.]